MESRFMTPLFFECDGTLEVCGPTNFGPDDVLLEITQLTIVDAAGNTMSPPTLPVITLAPSVTWETEIPGAKGRLQEGPATGAAAGFLVKRGRGRVPVAWPGSLTLVDGCAILEAIDPTLVKIWNDYLEDRRAHQKAEIEGIRQSICG
jgi:hypothetical protein